jgi:hypothetical protein
VADCGRHYRDHEAVRERDADEVCSRHDRPPADEHKRESAHELGRSTPEEVAFHDAGA